MAFHKCIATSQKLKVWYFKLDTSILFLLKQRERISGHVFCQLSTYHASKNALSDNNLLKDYLPNNQKWKITLWKREQIKIERGSKKERGVSVS